MDTKAPEQIVVTPTTDAGKTAEPSQEPKKERTEQEKAAFTLKKNAERLTELGGDPANVLGIKPKLNVDASLSDETPLTVGALRTIQKQDAKKTALQMASEIEDDDERTGVEAILNRLEPSGDPSKDLALARGAVTSERTKQIAEDVARKSNPNRTAAGGSVPANREEVFEPTPQEQVFMGRPYNMSKEKIVAARKEAEAKRLKQSGQ